MERARRTPNPDGASTSRTRASTIFLTWFTYDVDGSPMWLVATATQTTNPASSREPSTARRARASTRSIRANVVEYVRRQRHGDFRRMAIYATFAYTVEVAGMADPASQSKTITREIFAAPGTTCQ